MGESPFGNDPNDIQLRTYGVQLMSDLEMFYNDRDAQLDTVIKDDQQLNFSQLIRARLITDVDEMAMDSMERNEISRDKILKYSVRKLSPVLPGQTDEVAEHSSTTLGTAS